eukprot:5758833-Amphidinium_carterae.1
MFFSKDNEACHIREKEGPSMIVCHLDAVVDLKPTSCRFLLRFRRPKYAAQENETPNGHNKCAVD